MRKFIYRLLFNYNERVAITNALWHRHSSDSIQNSKSQNLEIQEWCGKLARELML